LILVAVLSVLVMVAALLGLFANGRDHQPDYLDELVRVPLVIGESEGEARAAIERVGLQTMVEHRYFREGHPRVGRVVGQSPFRQTLSRGCSVMILVSSAERRPGRDSPGDLAWTNYAPLLPAPLREALS
jgi:beta-lactam-binding protein with PASTA domain